MFLSCIIFTIHDIAARNVEVKWPHVWQRTWPGSESLWPGRRQALVSR